MSANVANGVQGFSTVIVYEDKTSFLKECWDSGDSTAMHLKERQC